jgi:hypothetical protein
MPVSVSQGGEKNKMEVDGSTGGNVRASGSGAIGTLTTITPTIKTKLIYIILKKYIYTDIYI